MEADQTVSLFNAAVKNNKHDFLVALPQSTHELMSTRKSPQILHIVCRNGWLDVAKKLITKYNMNPNLPNNGIIRAEVTSLHFACISGNIELVEYLISECGCDGSRPLAIDDSILHCAIFGGLYVFKHIANHPHVAPMISFNCDTSMIFFAYYNWDNDLIKYLIVECKCSIIINELTGDTVLHYAACAEGYVERLRFLIIECKCDICVTNNENGNTLLHTLCYSYDESQTNIQLQGALSSILTFLINNEEFKSESCRKLNRNGISSLELALMSRWVEGVKMIYQKAYKDCCELEFTMISRILLLAYRDWNESIIKFLIVEMRYTSAISTLCGIICQNGECAKLEFLVNECQVHIHDTRGSTTICYSHPKNNSDNYRQCSSISQGVGVAECSLLHLLNSAVRHRRSKIIAYVFEKCHLNLQQDLILDFPGIFSLAAYFFWEEKVIKYLLLEAKSAKITPIVDSFSGDTILHKACQAENIHHVKFLVEKCGCNPHIANYKSETLIHIACQNFIILQYLCINCYCCPDLTDDQEVGTIAMKVAIAEQKKGLAVVKHLVEKCKVVGNYDIMSFVYKTWCPDIVNYLIVEAKCDAYTYTDAKNNTILHMCALDQNCKKLKYLIDVCHCSPHIENNHGESLIHAACHYHTRWNCFDILQYLCIACNCCPELIGDQKVGNIAMKVAISQKQNGIAVVKHLIEKCKVVGNIEIMSFACENQCPPDMVNYLFVKAKLNLLTITGIIHLYASKNKHRQLKCLLEACHPQITSETAMFIVNCMEPVVLNHDSNIFYILKYLFIECKCIIRADYNIFNLANYCCRFNADSLWPAARHLIENCTVIDSFQINTILYLLVLNHIFEYSSELLSFINFLIDDCQCDISSQDMDGNTVLHLACSNFMGDQSLIELIMSTGKADPLSYNKFNETPLMLLDRRCHEIRSDDTTKKQIEQLMIRFGEIRIAHPIHLYVNVVLLGNPGVGKSTLAQVIKDRNRHSTITAPFKNVKGVELHTAGIIPNILNDKDIGRIILHDLAGQAEYYSSHTAVLENLLQGSAAVFVFVGSLADKNLINSFHQWLNIIENVSHNALHQCQLILVVSHADQSIGNDLNQLKQIADLRSSQSNNLTDGGSTILKNNGLFNLDCRKLGGGQLVKFVSALSTACKSITDSDTREMSLYCHMLYDFLQRDGKSVYTLQELAELSATKDNGLFLPRDVSQIDNIISHLNATGLIVFLRNHVELSKSWIVANKAVLLRDLNGILFAPQEFVQHVNIASNIGVVRLSDFHLIFPNYNPKLLLQFLQYMELCSVISSKFIIEELDNGQHSANVLTDIDQFIFIPALIKSSERPAKFDEVLFKFGWCLCCSGKKFFLSRFLHLLQLRLTCKFSDLKSYSTFEHYCKLWTKGVYWKDTKGVEALVEVAENNQAVVVLMSCEDGAKTQMLDLIYNVLAEVLSCKQQVMPQVVTNEFIIDSSSLHSSLESLANIPLYRVHLLARCYINNNSYIMDDELNVRVEISKIVTAETCNRDEICTAVFAGRDPQDIIKMKDAPVKLTSKRNVSELDNITEGAVQILKSHIPKILELVDPLKFANDLLSVGLLTNRTLERILTNTSLDRYEKASHIMSEINRCLQAFTNEERTEEMETFKKFCVILKDQHDLLKEISKEMMDCVDGL